MWLLFPENLAFNVLNIVNNYQRYKKIHAEKMMNGAKLPFKDEGTWLEIDDANCQKLIQE